jgi:hypothetical protein
VRCAFLAALALLPFLARRAEADETSSQLWGNLILDFTRGDGLVYEIDIEPKFQFVGDNPWRSLESTLRVDYAKNRWMDVIGELAFRRTKESDGVDSVAVTPRAGVRFHLLSNVRTMLPGRRPLGRVGIANLARVEWRNYWYSGDMPSSHEARFRNRLELKAGLNHAELTLDNTLYLVADYEIFVPLTDDVPERFASKARLRTGLGYRRDAKWRFELLYIREGTRSTDEGSFATSANIVNVRVKMVF